MIYSTSHKESLIYEIHHPPIHLNKLDGGRGGRVEIKLLKIIESYIKKS